VGPAVTLAVMLWGLAAPAYWGDEADTVSAVARPLPQLLRMLQHVDAVHGLYYVSMWPVARVLGTGEFATRLPSALAMAGAALGVAAIARRLVSARAAVCAGLLFALFPMVSAQGHDARPYGMVTAAAVLASYLLIRAVDDPRRRWFAAYGVSLVLLGYLELFGLLLVLAHAVTLAGLCHRGEPTAPRLVVRRWLAAVLGAVIATVPLVAYGWQQRAQIAWIAEPGWHDALSVVTSLAAGSTALAVVVWLLAVLGAMLGGTPALPLRSGLAQVAGRGSGPARTGRALTWLAAPWLAVPPALLLAASQIKPVYNFRYLVFCLPAMALLAGAGLVSLTSRFADGAWAANRQAQPHARSRAWLRGWAAPAIGLALIVALVAPTQLSIRVPGTGMRAVSQFLAARERPGDAIIYPGSGVPPWYLAYPDGLGRLRDIWMAESGPASGRLYGLRVTMPVLDQRERGVCRIWAAEMTPTRVSPDPYLVPGFRLVGTWQPQPGVRLWLYQRPGCTPALGTSR
jgi:mannosyltransferase